MNIKEKIKLVTDLVKHYRKLDKNFNQLNSQIGVDCNSNFYKVIWQGFEAHSSAISLLIGDHFNLVSWYIFDNECGKAGKELPFGSKIFKIKTVKDLIKYIELSS